MEFSSELTDSAVLAELGARLARHRLNKNLTQAAFALEAGVSAATVHRLEQGRSTQLANLIRVLRALHLLENFEVLVPAPPASPMSQVKMHGKVRRRASSRGAAPELSTWQWNGDE